jgi:hypothetical protein
MDDRKVTPACVECESDEAKELVEMMIGGTKGAMRSTLNFS